MKTSRGVVQLFNAVREQQKDMKSQLRQAGGSFRKQEKVIFSERAYFLNRKKYIWDFTKEKQFVNYLLIQSVFHQATFRCWRQSTRLTSSTCCLEKQWLREMSLQRRDADLRRRRSRRREMKRWSKSRAHGTFSGSANILTMSMPSLVRNKNTI